MEKKKDAVYGKCKRLGLQVEEGAKGSYASSSIKLPKELPGVEETLRILAGARALDIAIDRSSFEVFQVVVVVPKTVGSTTSK